ncbi:MAG: thioredoxin family protein [Deltaproteobacteria bacterium]|nr:thioredoxin family protein [Deltaproteobacteria bacterium]MBM4347359.1 thioredoxin family protein [Deltaproteobacteria bacterium]
MKKIKILGMGCTRCNQLADRTREAVKELGVEAEVIKVQDIKTITNYGVLVTPALVVDGVVKIAGKVPKSEEIKKWLEEERK